MLETLESVSISLFFSWMVIDLFNLGKIAIIQSILEAI